MQVVSPDQVGISSAQLSRIRQHMQRVVDEGHLAGIQTLLMRRDQVCHFESYGWQDREQAQALAADTIFRIYSMTKPIVSVAVMVLYEAGLLQLHDPVSKFLPGFADVQVYVDAHTRTALQRPILVHDLLTHTAGLTYDFLDSHPVDALYAEAASRFQDLTPEEFIARLCTLPLVFQPGTQWRYSVATDVLGVIVARIADMSLGEALSRMIFAPLDMTDTGFQVPASSWSRLATCYQHNAEGVLVPIMQPGTDEFSTGASFQSGGGGLVSTTADYLRFCRMLLHKGTLEGVRILGARTVDYMTANHLPPSLLPYGVQPNDLPGYGFGLGFGVLMDPPLSRQLAGKGEYGWAGAANTYFFIDPGEEMIGIFMSQLMPSGTNDSWKVFRTLAYSALQA